MAFCVAVGCKSRSGVIGKNNELIYFHYFPKDRELRAQWINNVQRGNAWAPSRYSRLCSLHFEKSCFRDGIVDKELLPGAVPTIFPNLPPAYTNRKRRQQAIDQHSPSKRPKNREIILPSSCRSQFQKYEKLLIMMPYYLRCRCCLRKRMLQDMWREQVHEGQREVFGEMLAECFALNLKQPTEHIEQICIVCITRLRQAVQFKQKVLASDSLINKCFYNVRLNFNSDSDTETTNDNEKNSDQENNENVKQQYFYKADTDTFEQDSFHQDSTDNLKQDEYIQVYTENAEQNYCVQENTENVDDEYFVQENTDNVDQEYYVQENADGETQDFNDRSIDSETQGESANEIDFNQETTDTEDKKHNQESPATDENKDNEFSSSLNQDNDEAEYLELEFLEDHDNVQIHEEVPLKPTEVLRKIDVSKKVFFVNKSPVKGNLKSSVAVVMKSKAKPNPEQEEAVNLKKDEGAENPIKCEGAVNLKKYEGAENVEKYQGEENLKKCLEAVKKKELSRDEASARYNVPKRTINKKMRADARKLSNSKLTPEEIKLKAQNENARLKLMQEIKYVLKYTDATPYKTKDARFYCAYCTNRGFFVNPTQLREHTRTEHAINRLLSVNTFMRPPQRHEVLKLDIENLTCTKCGSGINSWNDMFNHLSEKHELELEEAYTKIIPYKLDELNCVLCNQNFTNYSALDNHMNVHYVNYKCSDCHETFVTKKRLKSHEEIHSQGIFQCGFCLKVFHQELYRRRHVNMVHNRKLKFKCRFCPEAFRSAYPRHLHMIKNHRAKSEVFVCTPCDKTFNWRPYYLKHMRLKHLKRERLHQCTLCSKKFRSVSQLRSHENWHKGTRDCMCGVCGRKFVSRQFLLKHYERFHSARAVNEKPIILSS